MHFPKSIALTGADKFILALESTGRTKLPSDNVCVFQLDFDRDFDLEGFRQHILENAVMRYLSSLRLSGATNNFNAWKASGSDTPVILDTANAHINHTPFELSKEAPLRIHILEGTEKTTLVLVWHHLLMDGFGAILLLRHLNGEEVQLSLPRTGSRVTVKNLLAARRAKKYIDRSAKGSAQTVNFQVEAEVTPVAVEFPITPAQAAHLRERARQSQSKFGLGNYLLVLCARAVHRTFHETQACTYWIPIPQDTRRKNARGPVLGNQLSFLFYRLELDAGMRETEMVTQLNTQMMAQIKEQVPANYSHLLNFMRRFHPRWYNRLISNPSGPMLNSFSYTYAPEHPQTLMEFYGYPVRAAINLPPNNHPPGLTFSVHSFGDEMRVCVQSFAHILDSSRLEKFQAELQQMLTQAE